MPILDNGNYFLNDDLDHVLYPSPAEMRPFAPVTVHDQKQLIKRATWEHEQFKQSMRGRVPANDLQPVLMKIMMTTVNTCDVATVETIIDEVENMGGTECVEMMRNMIHLNQVPPMIAANMDYFDKYQRLDEHPGQPYDTKIRMETPISSVVLSGTPIEEHVERIMVDMLIKQPNASLGETVHMLL